MAVECNEYDLNVSTKSNEKQNERETKNENEN